MIASEKQNWGTRRHLTRREVKFIHASHKAAFWLAAATTVLVMIGLFWSGYPLALVLTVGTVALALSATVFGTLTDLTSMRIPDSLTLMVLVAAVGWWVMEYQGLVLREGAGAGRDIIGLIVPGLGVGPALPPLDGLFPGAWIALDILAGIIIFIPLCASFAFGLGGGDVKLMTALVFFLGWPLGFDFLILTLLFGGVAALGIIAIRVISWLVAKSGFHSSLTNRIAKMKTFAYAPAILAAAIVCIAEKSEGYLP